MDISELKSHIYGNVNRHPWELTRLKIINYFLQKHVKHIDHILDIGCGDAFVLKELHKKRTSVFYTGIDTALTKDLQQQLINESQEKINFYNSLPATLSPKSNCVLILDVIEHCENDLAVLESFLKNEILTDDANILITVPAFQSLFSQHDTILGHHRRYSLKQLQELCQISELKIIEHGYFFFSLLLIRKIQCILERKGKRTVTKTINNWSSGQWQTKSITACLWLDFLISRLFLKMGVRIPGLSIYCICQR